MNLRRRTKAANTPASSVLSKELSFDTVATTLPSTLAITQSYCSTYADDK